MLISVVIPCYNIEHYIEECVQSVFAQSHAPVEVICVDNNSTDGTKSVLKRLQEQYDALIVTDELKPGANAARNKGLSLAKGEWLQFLDADDLLAPGKLMHQVSLIGQQAHAPAFIAASCIHRNVHGHEVQAGRIERASFLGPFINACGITSSNLWRRTELLAIGGWNEALKSSQEADLMLRLVIAGGTYLVDETANTIIRERPSGQISQRDPAKKWKQYIEVRIGYLAELRKKYPEQYLQFQSHFYDFLMVSVLQLGKSDPASAIQYFLSEIKPFWKPGFHYGLSKNKVLLLRVIGMRGYLQLMKLK